MVVVQEKEEEEECDEEGSKEKIVKSPERKRENEKVIEIYRLR